MRLFLCPLISVLLATAAEAAQPAPPEWSLEPQLRIGSLDGGPYAFAIVGSVLVSPRTGNIFVADGHEVRVFDNEGGYLRTIGREGRGPGEFASLSSIGWRDDQLVAFDNLTRRVTIFHEDGTLVDSQLFEPGPIDGYDRPAQPAASLAGGAFLGIVRARLEAGEPREPLLLMTEDGEYTLLDELDVSDAVGTLQGDRGPVWVMRPLQARSLYRVDPFGAEIVIVHPRQRTSDGPPAFRIRKVRADGAVRFARTYAYEGVPLARATADSLVALRLPMLQRYGGIDRNALREALAFPDFQPPVASIVVGVEGSIWLQRETFGFERVRWWVLAENGDLVGQVTLPRRSRVLHVDGDEVWIAERDELDVPYAVKYRVHR